MPEPAGLGNITGHSANLLDWLNREIKHLLSKALQEKFNTNAKFDMRTEPLHEFCSFSQAIGAYALLEKGARPKPFSVQSLQNCHVGHAALTVELEQGETKHLYLVDPTFRQFCDANVPTYNGTPMPGYYLAQTESGQKIIKALLENGYMEVDANSANEYFSSFCTGRSPFDSPSAALDFMRNPPYDGCYENFEKNIMKNRGYLIKIANQHTSG